MTISKDGFVFPNSEFLPQTLKDIDKMPDSTFDEIVSRYVEMNIATPFQKGMAGQRESGLICYVNIDLAKPLIGQRLINLPIYMACAKALVTIWKFAIY